MGKYKTQYPKGNAMTLTMGQAARELGISDYMAGRLIRDGKLRSIKLGKLRRVPREALAELLAGGNADERNGTSKPSG